MGRFERILPRLGAGVGHALLNALVVLVAGKHFSWERFGRRDILESGEVLLLVAFVMSVVTIVFWIVPVRRRVAGATVVTACAIVATVIGTLVLGTQAAG
jgi:hypothetical protein